MNHKPPPPAHPLFDGPMLAAMDAGDDPSPRADRMRRRLAKLLASVPKITTASALVRPSDQPAAESRRVLPGKRRALSTAKNNKPK
jgi:hypothetical protein